MIVGNTGNKIKIEIDTDPKYLLDNIKVLTDKNFKIQSDDDCMQTSVNGSMKIYPDKDKLVFLLQPTEFR